MHQEFQKYIKKRISLIKLSGGIDLVNFEKLIFDHVEERRYGSEVTRIKNGKTGEVQNIANLRFDLYGTIKEAFKIAGATYALSVLTTPTFWVIGGWIVAAIDFVIAISKKSTISIDKDDVRVVITLFLLQESAPNKSFVILDKVLENLTDDLSEEKVLGSLKKLEDLKCIEWTDRSLRIVDEIKFESQE